MRGNSTRQSGHEAKDEHCWKPNIHKKAAFVHIHATRSHFGSILPFVDTKRSAIDPSFFGVEKPQPYRFFKVATFATPGFGESGFEPPRGLIPTPSISPPASTVSGIVCLEPSLLYAAACASFP
jgi:hypothetical protein